jgi:hypothetical protein
MRPKPLISIEKSTFLDYEVTDSGLMQLLELGRRRFSYFQSTPYGG